MLGIFFFFLSYVYAVTIETRKEDDEKMIWK